MSNTIPAIVLEFAKHAATESVPNPIPMTWKEYPGSWVVVFEDGRKVNFIKDEARPEYKTPPIKEVKLKRKEK